MVALTTSRRLTAAITREDDGFVAQCIEVDVASQGDTLDDALANLREALELYFEGAPDMEVGGPPLITSIDIEIPRTTMS